MLASAIRRASSGALKSVADRRRGRGVDAVTADVDLHGMARVAAEASFTWKSATARMHEAMADTIAGRTAALEV